MTTKATDGRKKLRAHWPPRRENHVNVSLPRELYGELWLMADMNEHSLQDEIRKRLRRSLDAEQSELLKLNRKLLARGYVIDELAGRND